MKLLRRGERDFVFRVLWQIIITHDGSQFGERCDVGLRLYVFVYLISNDGKHWGKSKGANRNWTPSDMIYLLNDLWKIHYVQMCECEFMNIEGGKRVWQTFFWPSNLSTNDVVFMVIKVVWMWLTKKKCFIVTIVLIFV